MFFMPQHPDKPAPSAEPMSPLPTKQLSDAARRALAEATERHEARATSTDQIPARKEVNGRDGPDPVRYGDWEVKGLTSDF